MMAMQIIDCVHGTEEWLVARMGIPTASEFATVMRTKGKGENGESKERRTYMLKLAGEIITGKPMESYSNAHMERGKEMEDDARTFYAFTTDTDPQSVGFIRSGNAGCSPDSLIGDEGMLEIKTALPHILASIILKDDFPPEHKAQCQGNLWIAQREWIDICVYWPGMPRFVKRAYRDNGYIANMAGAIDAFNAELAETVERLRRYGQPEKAAA